MIGRTLGHYRITEEIGKGGMGVVYRATDTKLNRDVALKILPEEFAKDPERLARFEREAQVLASLNHPNIAAIHGVEEDGGVRCLVLELVEGPTLADRLKSGSFPLEEALDIARQMAEGIEAAHEKGIIHRDLKPANVKVRDDGTVKVLDFGLAKALEPPKGETTLDHSPTVSQAATRAGTLLGTVAYMSPEQARAKPTDRRADIWAFGVVLFEMLAGQRPFRGGTVSDIITSILSREPDWAELPAKTPPPVRRVLRRCLEKKAKDRLHHIADARIEVAEVLSGRGEESIGAGAFADKAAPSWKSLLPWGAAALATVAAVTAAWLAVKQPPTGPGVSARYSILLPEETPLASLPPGPRLQLALSPDGSQLIYTGQAGEKNQLYLRDMRTGKVNPIPHTEGGFTPFFSPDGDWLGFFAEGMLKKVDLAGGEPVTLAAAPNPVGGTWGPDGNLYFNTNEGEGISKVPAEGGPVEVVTSGPSRWPEILPGGKDILYAANAGISSVGRGPIPGLQTVAGFPRFVPTGHLLYASLGKLLAVPFDPDTLRIAGTPTVILQDLRVENFQGGQFTVSQDGTMIYVPGLDSLFNQLTWIDRQGKEESLDLSPGVYGTFKLSPDGKKLVLPIGDSLLNRDLWIYDLERATNTRFTQPSEGVAQQFAWNPRWTPDGRHIIYAMGTVSSSSPDTPPERGLYWKASDGSREAVRIQCDSDPFTRADNPVLVLAPISFSPDGKVLALFSNTPGTGYDLWMIRFDGADPYNGDTVECKAFLQTKDAEAFPQFSPDGRWIAYGSNESGRYEIYVRPFPGPGPVTKISSEGAIESHWHPNGRELLYHDRSHWYSVEVSLGAEFRAGRPRPLTKHPFVNIPGFVTDLSPDGERFLGLTSPEPPGPRREIVVITNFFDELRRRVPVD